MPCVTYSGAVTTLFLVPHQDDETLSMGAAIREHVAVNGPSTVAVVLFTTGESSGARRVLREVGYVPEATGKVERVALTKRQFVGSRDAEFYGACRALGVPHGNIFMPGFTLTEDTGETYRRGSYTTASVPRLSRFRDGIADRVTQARRFVAAVDVVLAWFGAMHVKTISYADPSQDHRLLGAAVRASRRPTLSRRYYYPPYRVADTPAGAPVMHGKDAGPYLPQVEAAAREYGVWNPTAGRYSVGWFSVGADFGGPAGRVLRAPDRQPPTSSVAECRPVGEVRPPETPLFGRGRTLVHV